jgi:anti-anti-sigma factor
MLRINTRGTSGEISLTLEGKLAGAWVTELERTWRAASANAAGRPLRVNLNEVTFIDSAGKSLLATMHRHGVQLVAVTCMMKSIVEEISRRQDSEQPRTVQSHEQKK